jgi:hypothetical protein
VNSIAQASSRSNAQDQAGAKTPQGWLRPGARFGVRSVGASRRPIDTLRRRRIRRVIARTREACERRWRSSPRQGLRRLALEGRIPWEAPVGGGLKPRRSQGTSGRHGPSIRGSSGRSDASAAEIPLSQRRGFIAAEEVVIASGRGNLRRVNPRSAAGVKQNRPGVRGSKPSRG